MSDGPDRIPARLVDHPDHTVTGLASRAIAALAAKRASGVPPMSERLVTQLSEAAYARGDKAVEGAITDILHSGVPANEILDFYIPEAARRLGDGWTDDHLGFADVSIAVARLQRAMRLLSIAPRDLNFGSHDGESVLVAVIEGETHTLGAMTMTEQFRRRGVSVRLMLGEPNRKIVQAVADGQFSAVLFSVAVVDRLAEIRHLIEKVRQAAKYSAPVLVGGAVCGRGSDIVRLTGADYSCTDINEALRLCGLTNISRGARPRATSE